MKNIILLIKNINNYGIFVFLKIIFYEFLFFFSKKNIISLKHDSNNTSSYNETKSKKKYNTPYIPTPYYFLSIVKKLFVLKKINNFSLIDFGCGYSRSFFYFSKYFNLNYIGIDINKKIINVMKNFQFEKTDFFHCNLKNKNKRKKILQHIYDRKLSNKKIIIFFSDSFDTYSLKNILKDFKKFKKLYIVLVNVKNYNLIKKDFKIIDKYFFKNRNRNILIFKNG